MLNHKKVIPFPVVLYWSFFDLVQGGTNPIKDWYEKELTAGGRFTFDSTLKDCAKTENHLQWLGFKYLKGEAKPERIWQLDFIADKRQYRLLGVFQKGKEAILLLGCYHKGKVYTPPNSLETACKRAKALRDGKAGKVGREIKINI